MYGGVYYGGSYPGGYVLGDDPSHFPSSISEVDLEAKRYLYKIYDKGGDFVGIWTDVISEPNFDQQINNFSSSMDVELARNSDTLVPIFNDLAAEDDEDIITENDLGIALMVDTNNQIGSGTTVEEFLKVHVYVFYGYEDALQTENNMDIEAENGELITVSVGAPNGKIIFKGYISRYSSRYGDSETTLVNLLSDGDDLAQYVVEDIDDNTTVTYNSMDPSDILKDLIDNYNEDGGIITYGTDTIDDTGSTVSYTFNTNTLLEGAKKIVELSPSDWYSYIDLGTSQIYLKQLSEDPEHTFILGKHIGNFNLIKSIENMVNTVYFIGGDTGGGENLFKKYVDSGSVEDYGQRLLIMNDSRVTDTTSADLLAGNELDRSSAPRYQTTLNILDRVYDIESIVLGQLVTFRNFGNYIDELTLQIVGISYSPDRVAIQLDSLLPVVNKRVQDLKRNLDALYALNNPIAPS